MKKMRKWLAFMLAVGLMVSAMAVFAADEDKYYKETPTSVDGGTWFSSGSGVQYKGNQQPTADNSERTPQAGDSWYDTANNRVLNFDGSNWNQSIYDGLSCVTPDSGSSSKSALEKAAQAEAEAIQAQERAIQEQASRDAVRLAGAAMDEGFADVGDMYRASQKSMSAGEFYNNAVVSTPGIENAVTVGQGGNLVVNGQVTNMSATISKVTNRAYVDSVRIEQEGRVLNVVEVSYPATEATINFYMPSVTAEDAIVALQYNAGTWVEVEVAEVRADHVTLNMKGNGVVAFIAK